MGTVVGSILFVFFLLVVVGVFLKFYLESNHGIDRVIKKSGAANYRQYKREVAARMRKKRQMAKKRKAKEGQQ